MTRQSVQTPSGIAQALAQDRLGVRAVVFYVMSAAAPLTVVAGILPTAYAVTGLSGIPVVFLMVGAALALWSVGYVSMARHLPHAGAFYAYVSHGLGRVPGVGAAWVSVLSYNALQVALYGGFGGFAAPLVNQHFGIDLPWWTYALAAWSLVLLLGLCRVDLNGTVLAVLLVIEVLVVALYDFAFTIDPAAGLDFSPFLPTNLVDSGVGALLAIAVLGFTGFETTVVFSEESRDPRRTIPTATFVGIVLIAGIYAMSSWGIAVATGVGKVTQTAGEHLASGDLLFVLASDRLGTFFGDLGTFLMLTSMFAAMLSFHNTTARYTFALGRERIFPAPFGDTSASGVPRLASMAQSAIGLAFIVIYVAFDLDPFVQGFYTVGTSGGFGALVLITWTAYAIFFYFRRHRTDESTWTAVIAPALSIVVMTTMLTLAVLNFDAMLGVRPDAPLRWGIPLTFLAVAVIGTIYGAWLRAARRPVYAAIGMGAKSLTTSSLASAMYADQQVPAASSSSEGHR